MPVTVTNWVNGESVRSTRGEGATVDIDSTYLGDGDSSYWAVIFEDGKWVTVGQGWSVERGTAVDATPEIAEMWQAYVASNKAYGQAQYAKRRAEQEALEAEWEAATPRKGKTVVVVAGRKIPKGTTGEVFWYGETQWGFRVGFKTPGSDEAQWTNASNVEVVQALGKAA